MAALKGQYSIAQGNALGSRILRGDPALKGRNSMRCVMRMSHAPSGWTPIVASIPGRCPGLVDLRPFGAERLEAAKLTPNLRGSDPVKVVLVFERVPRYAGKGGRLLGMNGVGSLNSRPSPSRSPRVGALFLGSVSRGWLAARRCAVFAARGWVCYACPAGGVDRCQWCTS